MDRVDKHEDGELMASPASTGLLGDASEIVPEERSRNTRNTKGHELLRITSLRTNDGEKSGVPVGPLV